MLRSILELICSNIGRLSIITSFVHESVIQGNESPFVMAGTICGKALFCLISGLI